MSMRIDATGASHNMHSQQDIMEAYHEWRSWSEKAAADYSFHVAITWWDESVHKAMETLTREYGVNSFKHFMAYKGGSM